MDAEWSETVISAFPGANSSVTTRRHCRDRRAGGRSPGRPPAQKATNIVYVESNDPAGNAIFAFSRAGDGSLTPLAGSPFPAGGLGITPTFALGPFDSDQEVIVNPAGTMLFAVNGGSDTIAVFGINNDGTLTPVEGSPFPSGGSNPVSVGLSGSNLFVVNQDQDPGHPGQVFAQLHVVQGECRRHVDSRSAAQLITVDVGASPSQALPSPDGGLLFGADFLGGILRSFRIASSGRLTASAAEPLPPAIFAPSGAPPFPLGLAVHPTRNHLYVGFVTVNQIGVYNFSNAGRLRFVRAVPDSGNGVCWLRVNKAATRLYASNTGDPSVTVYDISQDPTNPIRDPEGDHGQHRRRVPDRARFDESVPARRHPADRTDLERHGQRAARLRGGRRRHAHGSPLVADDPSRAQSGPSARSRRALNVSMR